MFDICSSFTDDKGLKVKLPFAATTPFSPAVSHFLEVAKWGLHPVTNSSSWDVLEDSSVESPLASKSGLNSLPLL